jgi:hypothetical protein
MRGRCVFRTKDTNNRTQEIDVQEVHIQARMAQLHAYWSVQKLPAEENGHIAVCSAIHQLCKVRIIVDIHLYIADLPTNRGDMSSVSQYTLPPLLQSFETRIAARGPVKMEWRIIGTPSASVMTHRASVFGEDQPDTAFRQAVVRIESTQELTMSYDDGKKGRAFKPASRNGIRWSPPEVNKENKSEKEDKVEFADNGKLKRVVEYLVLQRRVISGKEDRDWKAWGFAKESTPERIEDDAVYWRRVLNEQAAGA